MATPIRAVFVDVSGVLVENLLPEIYARYEREHGINREVFRSVFHFLHSGNRSQTDLERYLASINLDPETWKTFTYDFHHSEGRNESLFRLLSDARKHGVKIIITSNNVVGLKAVLSRFGLTNFADLVISSAEIGLAKPDPAFYRYALKEAEKLVPDITPAEILVIDDHVDNVQSAARLGFQTEYYGPDRETVQASIAKLLS